MGGSIFLLTVAAALSPVMSPDTALDLRKEISPFLVCMRAFDADRVILSEKGRAIITEMERMIAEESASEEKNRDFDQRLLENRNATMALEAEADNQCNSSLYLKRLENKIGGLQPGTDPIETSSISSKLLGMFLMIDQDIAYYKAGQHPIYPSSPPPIRQTVVSSGDLTQYTAIPDQFWGEWRQNLDHCNSNGDGSVLNISQNRLVTQLENGKVEEVAAVGPRAVRVTASWAFGKSSERELITETYTLSEKGDRLSDRTYFGSESWRRCPGESTEKNAPNN